MENVIDFLYLVERKDFIPCWKGCLRALENLFTDTISNILTVHAFVTPEKVAHKSGIWKSFMALCTPCRLAWCKILTPSVLRNSSPLCSADLSSSCQPMVVKGQEVGDGDAAGRTCVVAWVLGLDVCEWWAMKVNRFCSDSCRLGYIKQWGVVLIDRVIMRRRLLLYLICTDWTTLPRYRLPG